MEQEIKIFNNQTKIKSQGKNERERERKEENEEYLCY